MPMTWRVPRQKYRGEAFALDGIRQWDYSHRCCRPRSPTARGVRMPASPMIEITYCRLCGWGLRAGWMAQELLTTFAEDLGSVTLTPDRTGGVFEGRIDDEGIWSRKERGRFPEIKEIKQLIRDRD